MSSRPFVLLLVYALAGAPGSARAQQTESRVTGRISDPSQGVLPGASVVVTSVATGATRETVTATDGTFTVTNLAPGRYKVRIEMPGFVTTEREVAVGVGEIKTLDVSLPIAGVDEAITVQGEAPVVDVSSAKIGVNVSPVEVEQLPVNGRNFANLMTLATGATTDGNGGWSSIRFNGKSNQQNYLNYDGVDGTYVFDANPGYLNVTGSQFRLQTSMESVAEFRVNSGLAPAESGLGTGGNITVVTKSGGNRFTGSVFEYKRDDALDSESPIDKRKQTLEMDQFGGSLGGPVSQNKTFFFVSYEGLRQKTGLTFTEAVPSNDARRRILAGEPTATGGGRSAERTRAITPLLAGFPTGGVITNNALLSLLSRGHEADQREDAATVRVDQRFTNTQSLYLRYLFSSGRLDTPDATVTDRRILARQRPQNLVANWQSILASSAVNELKLGINSPRNTASTFGPPGFPAEQASLSGVISSGSIDGRSTTGVAVSGLQIRQTSAASGGGLMLSPKSYAFSDNLTLTRAAHTFKFGGEYRWIAVDMNFLGGTTYSFGSVQDFIDNRPSTVQRVLDSGTLTAQQYYLIGYAQDTWRATDRLTFDLGVRYEFYSIVNEKDNRARPFIVSEGFVDASDFYDADYNNIGPRLASTFALNGKTVLRGGLGVFYGPGQFEDRIQPIENYITRARVTSADVPTLQYPVTPEQFGRFQQVRAYTREYPHEYNVQYGVSLQRELPGAFNLSVGYTGSQGRDLFLRGVTNTFQVVDGRAVRPLPQLGEIDYKTAGGESTFNALQIGLTRRFRSRFTGGFQYMLAENKGTSQGSNEAATASNTVDFASEYGANSTDVRHTMNGSMVYELPGQGALAGGWRVGGILNARSGVPMNVTIQRADTRVVSGVTVANIPGGNQRGTQRPDLVPGVSPYLKQGNQWINPAAFATPQTGAFGNAPRNYLRGPSFWQLDLMVSKDIPLMGDQAIQIRVEAFNIFNRANYANPAAVLPNSGTPGQAFTLDTVPPTFGVLTSPLNRTIGLGTPRQTQVSVRYRF